jgi:AcrR family transcriptional regulator
MSRAFSEGERRAIREALLEHGRRLFMAQGLRKTSVEELTDATAISKGAFYLFFASKEELFFELLERFEAGFQTELLAAVARTELPPRARILALLKRSLALMGAEPLFSRTGRAEYELLLRRLPPERVAAHLASDEAFAERFTAAWADAGVRLALPPPLVAGLFRALFFVSMHEEDFSPGSYGLVIDELAALVAARLIPEETL